MLLDVDHVAFSSLYIKRDSEIFQTVGYTVEFIETNVENLSIKRDFLRDFSEKHSIALLKSQKGFNIEFTNHGNAYASHPHMIPVFENLPHALINEYKKEENQNRIEVQMKISSAPIYLESNSLDKEFKFNKLVIRTNNSSETKRFFEILGFKTTNEENNMTKMEFKALFGSKSYFIFLKMN